MSIAHPFWIYLSGLSIGMQKKKKRKKPILAGPPPGRYTVLVEELENLPIREEYPKLKKKLQKDLKRAGDSVLRELLQTVSEDKRIAGYIYAIAKSDYQKVEDAYNTQMGKWAEQAREAIAKLKKAGKWHGQVYTADVERWIAANIPQWQTAKAQLRKATKIRDAARYFWEAYEQRQSGLQTYAKLIEKRRGISVQEHNA